MRDILHLLLLAVAVGGSLYLFNLLDLDGRIKKIANALVVMVAVVWAIRWLLERTH